MFRDASTQFRDEVPDCPTLCRDATWGKDRHCQVDSPKSPKERGGGCVHGLDSGLSRGELTPAKASLSLEGTKAGEAEEAGARRFSVLL